MLYIAAFRTVGKEFFLLYFFYYENKKLRTLKSFLTVVEKFVYFFNLFKLN